MGVLDSEEECRSPENMPIECMKTVFSFDFFFLPISVFNLPTHPQCFAYSVKVSRWKQKIKTYFVLDDTVSTIVPLETFYYYSEKYVIRIFFIFF